MSNQKGDIDENGLGWRLSIIRSPQKHANNVPLTNNNIQAFKARDIHIRETENEELSAGRRHQDTRIGATEMQYLNRVIKELFKDATMIMQQIERSYELKQREAAMVIRKIKPSAYNVMRDTTNLLKRLHRFYPDDKDCQKAVKNAFCRDTVRLDRADEIYVEMEYAACKLAILGKHFGGIIRDRSKSRDRSSSSINKTKNTTENSNRAESLECHTTHIIFPRGHDLRKTRAIPAQTSRSHSNENRMFEFERELVSLRKKLQRLEEKDRVNQFSINQGVRKKSVHSPKPNMIFNNPVIKQRTESGSEEEQGVITGRFDRRLSREARSIQINSKKDSSYQTFSASKNSNFEVAKHLYLLIKNLISCQFADDGTQLEQQIDIIKQGINYFVRRFAEKEPADTKLKSHVLTYLRSIKKGEELIKQRTLFDDESRRSFLEGIIGLTVKGSRDLGNHLEDYLDYNSHHSEISNTIANFDSLVIESQKLQTPKKSTPAESMRISDRSGSKRESKSNIVSETHLKIPSMRSIQSNKNTSRTASQYLSMKEEPTIVEGKPSTRTVFPITDLQGVITCIKLVNNEICLIGTEIGDIGVYELQNMRCRLILREHTSGVSSLETAMISIKKDQLPTPILLSGSSGSDPSVIIWSLEDFQPIKQLSGHENTISSIKDLGDKSTIATSSFDCNVAFWDLSSDMSCIQLLSEHNSPILTLEYSPEDSLLMSGAMDGCITIWRIIFDEGLFYGTTVTHKLKIGIMVQEIARAMSQPHILVVLGGDFKIRLYSLTRSNLLNTLEGEDFIDFVIVERPALVPIIFAVDKNTSIQQFDCWDKPQSGPFKKGSQVLDEYRPEGYNPRSQVIIYGRALQLLSVINAQHSLCIQTILE